MGITKIKAKTQKQEKQAPAKEVVKNKKTKKVISSEGKKPNKLFRALGKNKLLRYFIDSWRELKLVHWPSRQANWSLTGAVILFTGFFVVLVIFLDYIFQLLFKLIVR